MEESSLPVSTFLENFTSLLLDHLHNLTYNLEAAQPYQRRELIQEWTKEARDLAKYAESVLKFCRGSSEVYQKLSSLMSEMNKMNLFYGDELQRIVKPLSQIQMPFPFKPLQFEDAMKILSEKTYSGMPSIVYRLWQAGSVASKEANLFHLQQRYSKAPNADEVIQRVEKIIRGKLGFLGDKLPFDLKSPTTYAFFFLHHTPLGLSEESL